jgi:hypothetical protein
LNPIPEIARFQSNAHFRTCFLQHLLRPANQLIGIEIQKNLPGYGQNISEFLLNNIVVLPCYSASYNIGTIMA